MSEEDDPLARAETLLREEARRKAAQEAIKHRQPVAKLGRVAGTLEILWQRYLRRVWRFFSAPLRWYWHVCIWVFNRVSMTASGVYSKSRGAATIFGLLVVTVLFGYQLTFWAIPIAARLGYDAVAINATSQTATLIFGQPNGIEGRPGELVVYACSGYPCEGQFDATEFRIRDSVYLDLVSYFRYLQPHYPGELAGAFVSEENGCKVSYYGMRIKLLGFYPQITQAICQPINGNNAQAVLEQLEKIELR